MVRMREKLATNCYFNVGDWKAEMKSFLELNGGQGQATTEGEKAGDRLLKKFEELCEEHKMNLSLP